MQIGFLFKSINFEKERYLNTRFLSKIVDYKTNDRNNFYWRNLMDWNITQNFSSNIVFGILLFAMIIYWISFSIFRETKNRPGTAPFRLAPPRSNHTTKSNQLSWQHEIR